MKLFNESEVGMFHDYKTMQEMILWIWKHLRRSWWGRV